MFSNFEMYLLAVRQFKWRMSFDGANNKDRNGLQDAYNEAENIYQERVNHGASARHEEVLFS